MFPKLRATLLELVCTGVRGPLCVILWTWAWETITKMLILWLLLLLWVRNYPFWPKSLISSTSMKLVQANWLVCVEILTVLCKCWPNEWMHAISPPWIQATVVLNILVTFVGSHGWLPFWERECCKKIARSVGLFSWDWPLACKTATLTPAFIKNHLCTSLQFPKCRSASLETLHKCLRSEGSTQRSTNTY